MDRTEQRSQKPGVDTWRNRPRGVLEGTRNYTPPCMLQQCIRRHSNQTHQHELALCRGGTLDTMTHKSILPGHPRYTSTLRRRLRLDHNQPHRREPRSTNEPNVVHTDVTLRNPNIFSHARCGPPDWQMYGGEAITVQKIKSHQSLGDILDGSSACDMLGNERADDFARKGRAARPRQVGPVTVQNKLVKRVARAAATVLALVQGAEHSVAAAGRYTEKACTWPKRPWRGNELLWHAFEWFGDR